MITLALCFIYYGIAVLVYQTFIWWTENRWVSYEIGDLWRGIGGTTNFRGDGVEGLIAWWFAWPMSLGFLTIGLLILGTVFACRLYHENYLMRRRQKWILEETEKLGYDEWNMPSLLAEIDKKMKRVGILRRKPANPDEEGQPE